MTRLIWLFLACCFCTLPLLAEEAKVTVIKFDKGAWDPAKWTPVRMANQAEAKKLVQLDGAIGATLDTFTPADYNAEVDNAIALYDLGTTEAEIAVTFTMGKNVGGNGFSCPGLCISPVVKDGMVVSSIAVFSASYTLCVWYQTTGADGKTVGYRHLVQLGRGFDPAKPHVLRARISKKEGSVAIKMDDTDVLVISFIGNPNYGSVPDPVNSLIGLWGCHGECAFREMTITEPGALPFMVQTPEK